VSIPVAPRGAGTRPIALFVMGAARSGTSALTRVLSLCGGTLPPALLGADAANPRGYWEPRAAIHLNDVILHRYGSSAFDPSLRLQEEGGFDPEGERACIAKIEAFLHTLPAAPLVLIKDPRITSLSGLWFEAARRVGFDIAIVIAVRHPQEVVASLARYGRVSPELASALWLKSSLLAERDTREMPRVFVEYANLLDDWRREIKRIAGVLDLDLNTRDEDAIEDFLKPDLRRQRYDGPVAELFGEDWMSPVYETLCAAARDECWNDAVLDRVFVAYRASEQGFRTAFKDFRDHFNNVNLWPSVVWLIRGFYAVVHRRRGTWA
jgi:hypothetical protein